MTDLGFFIALNLLGKKQRRSCKRVKCVTWGAHWLKKQDPGDRACVKVGQINDFGEIHEDM